MSDTLGNRLDLAKAWSYHRAIDPYAVALGYIKGATPLHKFGHNEDVGSSDETIWTQGGLYNWLAAATTLKVSSTSTDDDEGGTGALTVQLYGLDTNYLEVDEMITMTGQTAVVTVNTYIRVYRLIVRSAGDGEENAGIIYVGTGNISSGVPDVVHALIGATENQTQMAIYTVPANRAALVRNVKFYSDSTKVTEYHMRVRPFGEVFQLKGDFHVAGEKVVDDYAFPLWYDEKTDIDLRAAASAGGQGVSATMDILVVDK